MQIEILTPEKKIYTGDVYGVQLPGVSGSFEVLEKHAPLVSALKNGVIKILLDNKGKTASYNISGGFIEVLNNKATLLLESASTAE
ncbi:MAG: ATP synthase F1 subunit epsilon [Bacteroidota bacterium]|jgi:F-type H+-transporting ATPase subunit epsilon|nr:ATP synthase F1 subunit epsilon [Chitinophagaceae bacterium]MCE2758066.1 ATP synthase F1 subunit epsilon [Chitinophagaceae bacterium]